MFAVLFLKMYIKSSRKFRIMNSVTRKRFEWYKLLFQIVKYIFFSFRTYLFYFLRSSKTMNPNEFITPLPHKGLSGKREMLEPHQYCGG